MQDAPFNNPPGKPFIELQSVDSTNNYALRLVHEGLAHHGTAFFAHEQTVGKGQRGKSWITEKGSNIILTIVLEPYPLLLSNQFHLSACIAVATCSFLNRYAGENVRIKWPNDIYWQDRKAGGILIENIIGGVNAPKNDKGRWKWALAGIGMNINQTHFPFQLANPVSLKQITGKNFDTVTLAKELCESIGHYYKELINGEHKKIVNDYRDALYKKDETVKLKKDSRTFEAVIKTVTDSGRLVIQHGVEEEVEFGEVEWILSKK